MVDSRFVPAIGNEPSTGERTILAIARALAHREFDDRELAIITYRVSGIDYPFRQCLWSLAVDQLPGMRNGILRTVVVVVETDIDVDMHCETGRGFRFALNKSRLLRRQPGYDDLRSAARLIANHQGPVVFFLGAGFSVSSRLPLGNKLRDEAIRRLLNIREAEGTSSYELAIRFHTWVSGHDWLTESEVVMREDEFANQLTLERVIRVEARVSGDTPTLAAFREHHDAVLDTPGKAALELGRVLATMVGRAVIVEVNFDRLVERHCPVALKVFYSTSQFDSAATYVQAYLAGTETAIPILKLHGSIEDFATCVVSDEQTERGIGREKLSALRSLLHRESPVLWVYVGASMRDRDLLPVLRSEDFALGADERWVSPFLDVSVESFAMDRKAFWAGTALVSMSDRLITETADAFFGALREAFQ
jgi:hypothetical protein